jgi:chaperonin cofactor prefoldin
MNFIILLTLIQAYKASESLETRLKKVSSTIHEIKTLTDDFYIQSIYKEILSIQNTLKLIQSEIIVLDNISNSQMEHHSPFSMKEVESTIKVSDGIVEKIAVLDTKLINVDDREILDKLEDYVLNMDKFDGFLRKNSRKLKERIEKFNKHIKDDHGHYWLGVMTGTIAGLLLWSWWTLYK